MRGAVLHAPGDVRIEQLPDPEIAEPTDAIIRLSATCVCGSDLWPYRGINEVTEPTPIGHEYCGVVENLRASGMEVEQVLGTLGIVTGSAPEGALDALRGVEGVDSVDEQLAYRLPPPDSPIQ